MLKSRKKPNVCENIDQNITDENFASNWHKSINFGEKLKK